MASRTIFISCLAELSLFTIFIPICSAQARSAVCYLRPDPASSQKVTGTVSFYQASAADQITIRVNADGFNQISAADETKHGFHVHALGDLTGGCGSTLGHYNPDNVNHGAPTDAVRHPGDFGNLKQNVDGTMSAVFQDHLASLYGDHSIIGRSIVVHAGVDDLGKGGNDASLANGNAGARLACCVIGWTK